MPINFQNSSGRTTDIRTGYTYHTLLSNIDSKNPLFRSIDKQIGSFNHYWFVVYEDEYKWYYFTCSSRFYSSIFSQEIGCFVNFFSEHKNKSMIKHFLNQNPTIESMLTKYGETSCKLRDSLFLLNKDKYGLALESILDLYKLNYMPKIVLDKLQKEGCAIISEKNIIRDIDKYLIGHTIKSSLRVNEVEPNIPDITNKIGEEYSNINLIRPS